MATKAQQFRYEAERSKPKRQAAPKRAPKRRSTLDAGALNITQRGAKQTSVVTEASLSGKRSRKSTRASSHHGKNSTALEYAARMKSQSPQRRHAQRSSR